MPSAEWELDPQGRPFLDRPLRRLIDAIGEADSERLGHIDGRRILVVAGAARRSANASIRPLTYGGSGPSRVSGAHLKPSITLDGVAMRYEICLRPRFFLTLGPAARLRVLVHELWHIDPSFDGTLARTRRHSKAGPHGDDTTIDAIVRAFRDAGSPHVDGLTVEGEARLRAWTSRPPSRMPRDAAYRDSYDERDLHHAIVTFTDDQLP